MTAKKQDKRSMWMIVAVAALLALGGGVWAYSSKTASPTKVAMVDEDPGKMFVKMRELRERTDISEDQRQKAFSELREQMEAQMDIRVNTYFAATTQEEKNRMLDKSIDNMEKRRQEFENERRREEANTSAASRPSREERRRQWMNSTPQERKTRSESRSADSDARRRAYRAAMEGRMKERGIKPPQWGGPGGGGRGNDGRGGNRRT